MKPFALPFLIAAVVLLSCWFFLFRQTYAAVVPPAPRDFRVRLIEAVLLAEARGEGAHGVRMVAEVIRNRARQQHTLPIYVVQKPKQFSCLNGILPDRLIENMETTSTPADVRNMAQRCAEALVFPNDRAFNVLNFDYAHGATHYHAAGPKPNWAGGRKPVAAYKNHIFYRL